jgi:hypothetical protein
MENLVQEFYKSTREVQSFWEQRFAEMLDEAVKSQHFVQAMTKSLEASLDIRKMLDSSIGRWAEFYQVVTRKDLAILQQQMFDQNHRLEKVLEVLEDIKAALPTLAAGKAAEPTTATAPDDAASEPTDRTRRQGKNAKHR